MLGYGYYSYDLIKKMTIAFGFLFKEIHIRDIDPSGTILNDFLLPVSYGSKEKHLSRVESRAKGEQVALTMPRIAFLMTGLEKDSSRALNKRNQYTNIISNDGNKLLTQYNYVPYNFNFDVYLLVKRTEDGYKVVEQILPFFTPELNLRLKLVGDMNIELDVPVILNSVSFDDNYEGALDIKRVISWTLNFTMKSYLFGPINRQPVIKRAITRLGVDDKLFEQYTTIPVVPGKTLDEITELDNYGIEVTREDI